MKSYLLIGALLTMSICAIGSPEPDRQSPDHAIVVLDEVNLLASPSFNLQIVPSIQFEAIVISEKEQDVSIIEIDLIKQLSGTVMDAIVIHRDLSELVIEENKKPKDKYRLPIWDYIPSIEPPRKTGFKS